ncbi:hypothetical protein FACS189459_3290 [Bacilli bacterium]|nr:hypothetical protein FACS189459_3290 [Bacilli bacterium]
MSSKFEKDNDPQNAIIPTKINNNEQSVEILSIPFQTSQAQYLYTNTFTTNNVHEQLELTNIKHDDNAVTKEQAGINVTQSGDSGDSGDQSLIFNKIISGVQVGVDSGMYTFDIVDTCTKNGYFTYILTTHVKYQIIPTDLSNLKINVEKSNITYGYTLAKFKLSVSSNAGYNFIYKLDPRYTDSHFHIIHDANNNYYLQLDTGLNVNKYHFAVYAELPQTNNVKLPNTLDDDIEVRKATIIDGCKIIVNGQHLSNVGDNIHSKINLIYNQSSQET